jgi:hypothetical protein
VIVVTGADITATTALLISFYEIKSQVGKARKKRNKRKFLYKLSFFFFWYNLER